MLCQVPTAVQPADMHPLIMDKHNAEHALCCSPIPSSKACSVHVGPATPVVVKPIDATLSASAILGWADGW